VALHSGEGKRRPADSPGGRRGGYCAVLPDVPLPPVVGAGVVAAGGVVVEPVGPLVIDEPRPQTIMPMIANTTTTATIVQIMRELPPARS